MPLEIGSTSAARLASQNVQRNDVLCWLSAAVSSCRNGLTG